MANTKDSVIKSIQDYAEKLKVTTLPNLSVVTWNDLRKLETRLRYRYLYTK